MATQNVSPDPVYSTVSWKHVDPATGSTTHTSKNGELWHSMEYEPLGQEVNPFGDQEEFPSSPMQYDTSMNDASDPQWQCDISYAMGHTFWDQPSHCRDVAAYGDSLRPDQTVEIIIGEKKQSDDLGIRTDKYDNSASDDTLAYAKLATYKQSGDEKKKKKKDGQTTGGLIFNSCTIGDPGCSPVPIATVDVFYTILGTSEDPSHYAEYSGPATIETTISQVPLKKLPCPPLPVTRPDGVNIDANISEASARKALAVSSVNTPGSHVTDVIAHAMWFTDQVRPGGSWDYKTRGEGFEEFGNFHYGATGSAAGFSDGQLLQSAGLVQQWFGQSEGDGGDAGVISAVLGMGGKAPYGDQIRDQEAIKRGVNYYQSKFVKRDCQ